MGIVLTQKGDFKRTERFLEKLEDKEWMALLDTYGERGVDALKNATPKDTGKTASSWEYRIEKRYGNNEIAVVWTNSNINKGVNIALILQYGHATRFGGYVVGIDYINPALKPIFEEMAEEVWKEVTKV